MCLNFDLVLSGLLDEAIFRFESATAAGDFRAIRFWHLQKALLEQVIFTQSGEIVDAGELATTARLRLKLFLGYLGDEQ